MTMLTSQAQLCIPYLRQSRVANPLNYSFGKVIILTSACDEEVTYHGWTPYCTTKAALTRFITCLAHEEPLLSVQGVYPKLTRTKMPEDVIAGKYKGIMADHEIERFRIWNEMGDEMVVSSSSYKDLVRDADYGTRNHQNGVEKLLQS